MTSIPMVVSSSAVEIRWEDSFSNDRSHAAAQHEAINNRKISRTAYDRHASMRNAAILRGGLNLDHVNESRGNYSTTLGGAPLFDWGNDSGESLLRRAVDASGL